MPTILPFVAMGLQAVGTGINAIQNADAAGEANKQTAAAKLEQERLLAEKTKQDEITKSGQDGIATRDAQLAKLNGQGAFFSPNIHTNPMGLPGLSAPSGGGTGFLQL